MIRRYIECSNCGERIYEGDIIHKEEGLCGLYCSARCYLNSVPVNYRQKRLTDKEVDLSGSEWKEEADE